MTLTRRTLLTSAPLLVGAPWLRGEVSPLAAAPPLASQAAPRQLSPALLAHTSRTLGLATARLHLRTATRSDLLAAADSLQLLRAHLAETPFHDTLEALARQVSPSQIDRDDLARRAYKEIYFYDHAVSLDEIQARLPEDFSQGLTIICERSIGSGLAQMEYALHSQALSLPVTYARPNGSFALSPGTFYLRRVQDPSPGPPGSTPTFCQQADLYLNLIGGALGIVALLGCTADPAVFLICPAIGLLATILGAASFMEWLWCD